MRRRMKHEAPEGFVSLLWEAMEKRKMSLNQLAERGGISPAYLSRILNRERGLPSDKTILRLTSVLNLEPAERLLLKRDVSLRNSKPMLSRPLHSCAVASDGQV